MYKLFNDFVGQLPLNQQFLIPVTYAILIILLILFIMRFFGVFRK